MNEQIELSAETKAPPPEPGRAALVEIGERGLMLRSLDDLLRFARMCVADGAAPKGMTHGQAALAIQAGLERGLGPLGGLQQCVVVNGVLSWRGQGAAALIQNSPACIRGTLRFWHEGEGDLQKGVAVAHRVGYREADRREFTVQDARRGRLWGKAGPWTEYPGRMLAWRALGLLARDVFPDVLGGFPMAEEAVDFEAPATPMPPPRVALPPASPDPLMAVIGLPSDPTEAERWGVLAARARAATGDDEAAQADLLRELEAARDEGGIGAAEKRLRTHPVFGGE